MTATVLVPWRDVTPPGFKFTPTDEELISDYLLPMISGLPAPSMTITVADIYKTEPWNLPPQAFVHGDRSNEAFFFTPRRSTAAASSCSRAQRAAGSGIWQINSRYVPVYDADGQRVIGSKAPLVFTVNSAHTGWIMYEYIPRDGPKFQSHALCRVYRKPDGARRESIAAAKAMIIPPPPPPPPPPRKKQNAHKETADVKLQAKVEGPALLLPPAAAGLFDVLKEEEEEEEEEAKSASGPMAWGPALAAFVKAIKVEDPPPPVPDGTDYCKHEAETEERIQSPRPVQSPIPSSPPHTETVDEVLKKDSPQPPASCAQQPDESPPAATLDASEENDVEEGDDVFHGPLIDLQELEFRPDRGRSMDFLAQPVPLPSIWVDLHRECFNEGSSTSFVCDFADMFLSKDLEESILESVYSTLFV